MTSDVALAVLVLGAGSVLPLVDADIPPAFGPLLRVLVCVSECVPLPLWYTDLSNLYLTHHYGSGFAGPRLSETRTNELVNTTWREHERGDEREQRELHGGHACPPSPTFLSLLF